MRGIAPKSLITLEALGRKSGKVITFPLVVLTRGRCNPPSHFLDVFRTV